MKNRFFFICLFLTSFCFAQTRITGTVYEISGPLEGVAVYLNNSMLGTTTNASGTFSFPVKEGQYNLIISYLGYKKIIYPLNTSTYSKPLVFTLVEEENVLDEIFFKKVVYDKKWKNNLSVFKKEFIGISALSKDCEILNATVLYFEFNAKDNIFKAHAREPLQIKHKSLGYLITYELESFVKNKNYVTYLGYSRYQELPGNKRKQKRWKQNRLKAYNGSAIHFYKSVIQNKIKEVGYTVNLFKRVPNKERPSEASIKKARELVKLSGKFINFSRKIDTPKNAIDSAMVVLKKMKLPKYRDYVYKNDITTDEIITVTNNVINLDFENNLNIVYSREKEEEGFILRLPYNKRKAPGFQSSYLIPLKYKTVLDKKGILVRPLDVFYEGYWSYEKFANSLPLDYVPPISK